MKSISCTTDLYIKVIFPIKKNIRFLICNEKSIVAHAKGRQSNATNNAATIHATFIHHVIVFAFACSRRLPPFHARSNDRKIGFETPGTPTTTDERRELRALPCFPRSLKGLEHEAVRNDRKSHPGDSSGRFSRFVGWPYRQDALV